MFLINVMWSWS